MPQPRSDRIARLTTARRTESEAKRLAVTAAIETLTREGARVTHAAVARTAGVSSWFTYNTSGIPEAIRAAAQRQSETPALVSTPGPKLTGRVSQLEKGVDDLRRRVEVLEETPARADQVRTQAAALRYPGAKWSLASQIASRFAPHYHYVEPYFGSGAVFFTKEPSPHEMLNDLNGQVINMWRVLRDRTEQLCWALETTPWSREEYAVSDKVTGDDLEDARRFVVRVWQAHASDLAKKTGWKNRGIHQRAGGMSHRWQKVPDQLRTLAWRLSDAEIESRDALEVIRRSNGADVLIYADPPYLHETRTQKMYAEEVDVDHHIGLLSLLMAHKGPVVLSGYANSLYDDALDDWERVVMKAPKVEKGAARAEVLWIKPGR